jgi:hypothetical protein
MAPNKDSRIHSSLLTVSVCVIVVVTVGVVVRVRVGVIVFVMVGLENLYLSIIRPEIWFWLVRIARQTHELSIL